MKKLILLIALGISLCANAQLTVVESDRVVVGNNNSFTSTSPAAILNICNTSPTLGSNTPSGSVSFGGGTGSMISGSSSTGYLLLSAGQSMSFGVGKIPNALILDGSTSSCTSVYPMRAPSFLTTSDARIKTNVESLSESYSRLTDVNAVSYNLIVPKNSDASVLSEDNSDSEENVVDDRTHFGFIAQEIQKIYPNLVVEDEEGMLAIDYTGFIPLLVEAYKDLSSKVKEQEEVIDALLGQKGPSYMPASVNGVADSKASLKQNKPNPFNTTTTIECNVPQSVASAFICVYDLQGKQVHRIDIQERGNVVNVIDASYFTPGMYIYALIADGTEIDSKRMIITD